MGPARAFPSRPQKWIGRCDSNSQIRANRGCWTSPSALPLANDAKTSYFLRHTLEVCIGANSGQ